MTPTEIRAAVHGLRTQGHGLREISRLLAMSRNKVCIPRRCDFIR